MLDGSEHPALGTVDSPSHHLPEGGPQAGGTRHEDQGLPPHRTKEWSPGFLLAFGVCAFFSLIPLWSAHYPPMVDLPQHVAQVAIWKHLDDPAFNLSGQYQFNWFQSYLGFYLLLLLGSVVLPLLTACKVVLSLFVIGLPLSILWMLRVTGRDPWRSLMGFPLAYGFSYYFGFAPFLIATPLVFVFVGQVFRYLREPTFTRGLQLAGIGVLLWFFHLIAMAIALAMGGPLLLLLLPDRRAFFRSLLFLLPAILLGIGYFVHRFIVGEQLYAQTGTVWLFGWYRLSDFPFILLGTPGPWPTAGTLALVLAVFAGLRGPEKNWRYWALWFPAALSLMLYMLLPWSAMGVWYIQQRFALFVLPFLCLLTREGDAGFRAWLMRSLLVLVTIGMALHVLPRVWAFDEDARDFDRVRVEMKSGRETMNLAISQRCREDGIPVYPIFQHFSAWHQVEKGGRYCFSFAEWSAMPLHLKPPWRRGATNDLAGKLNAFRWDRHGFADYYIVRSPEDISETLFKAADAPIYLRAHKGWWWLYEKLPPSGVPGPPPR